MRESMNEFRDLLKAKVQCIWINTYEEAEAMEDIKEVVQEVLPQYGLRMWSQTGGITGIPLYKGEEVDHSMEDMNLFPMVLHMIQEDLDNSASPFVYVFRDLSNIISDAETRRSIRDMKEAPNHRYIPFVVLAPITSIPTDIAQLFRIVDYGLPPLSLIRQKLEAANATLRRRQSEGHPATPLTDERLEEACKACFGLTIKEIKMALSESIVKTATIDVDFLLQAKIEAVKKSGALDYKIPKLKLCDIGGNEAIKAWMEEQKIGFSEEAREFGLPTPKGYMSVGIPGCGKTALAEAFAGEMDWPLLELSMSKVMDSLVGESEKRIAYALEVAKASAPCVLLLDEVEKMLGGINSSNNSDSGITARVFGTLLKFMNDNDSGVYVIMTSNDVSQLPPEFTRSGRLDVTWYFGLPREKDRGGIFKIHFDKLGHPASQSVLNAGANASSDFTGAEIENAVKIALRKAFVRSRDDGNTDIMEEDIIEACDETIPVARSSREKIIALENYCASRARRSDGGYDDEADADENKKGYEYDDIFSI